MQDNKFHKFLLLLSLCLQLTGCASLVITVDVYKGPLINNERVQIEEAAMLALASKPLIKMLASEFLFFGQGINDPTMDVLRKELDAILCFYRTCLNNEEVKALEPSLEDTLKEYFTNDDDPDQKDLLLRRLTRFGSHLRILGNFSLLAAVPIYSVTPKDGKEQLVSRTENLRYFVQVLQAVGNSIIFQVDSIQLANEWDKKRRKEADSELKAIASAGLKDSLAEIENGKNSISRIDALDMVISALEYKYIASIQDSKTNDEEKQALKEAIIEANKYRSSLIFLRSSTEFLRSSYPATTLQKGKDETTDTKNEFLKFLLGSVPPDFGKEALQKELDHQYWQNINEIRLIAGGNTNYAVVKDDIGNWYIKGYSTNPDVIFESLENLSVGAILKATGAQ